MADLIQLRIQSVKWETSDAKTYVLEPLGTSPNFTPGQFLTFIVKAGREELRRSYSIISLPGEPLAVTVQRVENGEVSRLILISWKPGDILLALPPAGRFTLRARKDLARDIFFLAAGSGITPILPQIRQLLRQEAQSNIYLLYSNKSEDRILFRDIIDKVQRDFPRFTVFHFLSDPKNAWQKRKRLNNGSLEILVRNNLRYEPKDAVFMVCGPFTYMRMVRLTLIFMKFGEEQIRTENFLPELMRSETRSAPVFPDRSVGISLHGSHHAVEVKSRQSILKGALEAGVQLPYSCQGGVCSSCAALCTKGSVKMSINEVLTDDDLKKGWVLTCTGYPATDDVEILFPELQ